MNCSVDLYFSCAFPFDGETRFLSEKTDFYKIGVVTLFIYLFLKGKIK